jgi:hypothetical protein
MTYWYVVERPEGYVGDYSPEERKERLEKFAEKRKQRVWTKKVPPSPSPSPTDSTHFLGYYITHRYYIYI